MSGRILIADDFLTNRIVLKVRLTASCYDVVQADTSGEVVEMARHCRPDLIILGADGNRSASALCEQLKADAVLTHIPLLVIAHDSANEPRLEILKAGADEVFGKPLDESTLLATVRSLIRRRGTYDDVLRRKDLAHEFGVAEAPQAFAGRAKVALIAPDAETGILWRMHLATEFRHELLIMTQSQALEDLSTQSRVPDAFIIGSTLAETSDGLRLVSELRSRRTTRHSVIVVQDCGETPSPNSMALDLGADTAMRGRFDAAELAVKLDRLLARKTEADALRENVRSGLELALQDPLTGLHNRRYAQSYLQRLEQESLEKRQPYAIMILDLDRFKSVNDRYGHLVGDEVLIEVSNRLRSNMRDSDLVARFGGEEFLIALPATDETAARIMGERLRRAIGDQPIRSHGIGQDLNITLSIGVAVSTPERGRHKSMQELLQAADRALYVAKSDGRNQVTFVQTAA